MTSLTGYTKYIAVFFDNSGAFVGSSSIITSLRSPVLTTFDYKDRSFVFNPLSSSSVLSLFPYFFDYKLFYYNINNPNAMLFTPTGASLSSNDLNSILKSDVLVKLNNVRRSSFLDLLTFRNIVIALIVLGVLYYAYSKGYLGGVPSDVANNTSVILNNATSPRFGVPKVV